MSEASIMCYHVLHHLCDVNRCSAILYTDSGLPLCRGLHDWHEQQPLLSHITGRGCA